MRLRQDRLQKIKNYLHAFQGSLIFLTTLLTIAVYTRNGPSDSRTGWYFALCWITMPVLIYLVMVPMWSRTQKFAHPYAFATIDCLYTILWLSAWASVASYVSAGGGCSNFSLGSNGKCKLSESTVVLGVVIMGIFGATSYLSLRTAMHFRKTGMMPFDQQPNDIEVQTNDDAFSSNMQKDDFEEDTQSRRGSSLAHDQEPSPFDPTSYGQGDQYAPLHQAEQQDEEVSQPHIAGLGLRYHNSSVTDLNHDTSYGGPNGGDQRFS